MNQQEQNKIKIPHHAVLWTLQRFCAPISYLGCEIFLAEFITSDRGITSRTNGHRFVQVRAVFASRLHWAGGAQQCRPPFLAGLQLPSPLGSPPARWDLPALPASLP